MGAWIRDLAPIALMAVVLNDPPPAFYTGPGHRELGELGELPVSVGFLVLGVVMTWCLPDVHRVKGGRRGERRNDRGAVSNHAAG